MEVLEQDGEILFLRKLKEGAAPESYGLHVARLAGIPERVLVRAGSILEQIKETGRGLGNSSVLPAFSGSSAPGAGKTDSPGETAPDPADRTGVPGSPGNGRYGFLINEIKTLNLDHMTPMEALNRIYAWKELLGSKSSSRTYRKSRTPAEPSLFDS
jgi:DNA mismatch repair protein MutS